MIPVSVAFQVPALPMFLDGLTSLALAILEPDGRVRAANRGFLYLAHLDRPPADPWNGRSLFLNPPFAVLASLLTEAREPVYEGLLNLGDAQQGCRSLNGCVHRLEDGALLVAAEHDVAELERLTAQVLHLNEELADTQRALALANRELRQREATIRQLLNTDPLTGAANRRHLDQRLAEEVERCRRHGRPLAVIMADIDHFKAVNDGHGHAAGDAVLRCFAELLRTHSRASDLVARYGGEEFTVLLPEASPPEAAAVAERLRAALAGQVQAALGRAVTASFGVALLRENEPIETLLARADQALYRSKHAGRNRVTLAD